MTRCKTMDVRRARPLLGTFVEIRVTDAAESNALRAIDAAFAEIATVHRLMSFHEPDSDLGRLNREAVDRPTPVDARTWEVLQLALELASESDGRFDPTVAAELVEWGLLPRPAGGQRPDGAASWRDVELLGDRRVRFARPLWLDLGGIAKGYAVDRAIECLLGAGVTDAGVNAGGDLRLIGPRVELVHLRLPQSPASIVPALELTAGSMATSTGYFERRRHGGQWVGPHVHGQRRRPMDTRSTVSVVAERCVVADALTKIVMSDRRFARGVLRRHAAIAFVHDPRRGWRVLDGGDP